ncbi:hypothetical protein IV203_015133 [Nitzschia inconspicua]|uniref:Uncharacterized protein n=1 Tax=Nitzschia inconspicua TaxID=303405 RepID=A0A9K3PVD2_9STRA|nr:hypothetical protein IV203_015133 [Nitzschia inconspicua]
MALGGGHVMTYGGLGVISSQVKGHREKILEEEWTSNEKRSLRDRWSSIRRRRQSNIADESEASPSVIVSTNDELSGAHGKEVVVEQVSSDVGGCRKIDILPAMSMSILKKSSK